MLGISVALTLLIAMQNPLPVQTGSYEIKYPSYFGNRTNIQPDNPLTKEGVLLGRMLFYEAKLSSNNKVSCGSCHIQSLAFTDGKRFSQGVGTQPTDRNSMSLANLLWVRNFFWDGRSPNLEQQAIIPMTHPNEMGQSLEASSKKLQQTANYPKLFKQVFGSGNITGERIAKAISQFERTLISANSYYDKYLQNTYKPTPSELRGISLFFGEQGNMRGMNCGHCHSGAQTFSNTFHNNGIDSLPIDLGREKITGLTNDKGRFRVATLRNIALTAPYMHDGRFTTLEEVLDHYGEHIKASPTLSPFLQNNQAFTPQERKDIIAFLHMLTDSTFITNPEFSNPHSKP